MKQLTDHFSLEELTESQTAARRGIDNTPTPAILDNLTRVAQMLERVRTALGAKPILVSSGYRSPALNKAVGGASNSAHLNGLAADFTCPAFGSPQEICRKIQTSGIPFDQCIFEDTWVHLGLAAAGQKPRQQLLTARFGSGATTYSTGIPAAFNA